MSSARSLNYMNTKKERQQAAAARFKERHPNYGKLAYAENPQYYKERAKQRLLNHPETPKMRRNRALRCKYRLTPEEWERLLSAQNQTCKLCRTALPADTKKIHTDHCHQTGAIRGILCVTCNHLLGAIEGRGLTPAKIQSYLDQRPADFVWDIIGLTGRATSGKDTAAQALLARGYQRIAFADAVKEMLAALDPEVDGEFISAQLATAGWDTVKQNPKVRRLLQRLGTEAGRNIIGPDVWVDLAHKKLRQGGRFVFTDCRFPSEIAALKSWGATIARITRPGIKKLDHASENFVDHLPVDVEIENNGSVADLHRAVNELLKPKFLDRRRAKIA